jgi:hypothetical protein
VQQAEEIRRVADSMRTTVAPCSRSSVATGPAAPAPSLEDVQPRVDAALHQKARFRGDFWLLAREAASR